MKFKAGDTLVLQLGKAYKKKSITFDLQVCLKVMIELHPELGLSKAQLKRLIEQGGITVYYQQL